MKLSYGKLNKFMLAGVVAVGIAGCSDSDDAKKASEKAEKVELAAVEKAVETFDLLSLVPADSPYVMVGSRKMPVELSEKVLKASAVNIDNGALRAQIVSTQDGATSEEKLPKLIDAVLAELEGKMSTKGLESLGVPINGRSLFYGLGVLPVGWLEILDAGKVEAFLGRVEERSGLKSEKLTRGEISYRRFDMDDLVGILGIGKKHLIVAVLPTKSEAELLPMVFGETKPEKSLADTKSFAEFTAKRKFLGYGDGYIDLVRFAEIALGESQGINAQVLQAMGSKPSELSPECRSFIKTTVQSVPMISFGLTEATSQKYAMRATVETSAGVAGWLQKMVAPVPGVGVANDGMFSFGMGADLPQVRDGIKAMLRNFLETGKGCELVSEQSIAESMQGVDAVFNPMVIGMGVKGFNLTVNNVEIDTQTMSPKAVDAQFLMVAADPKSMFGMLGMLNPQIAQLDIPADGSPVKVPLEAMAPMAPPTYVAIKDTTLALKLGDKAADGMDKLLSLNVAERAPLLAMDYDAAKVFKVIGPAMQGMMQSMQGEDAEGMKSAYQSMETAAKIYGRIDFQMLPTTEGLQMDSVINFK